MVHAWHLAGRPDPEAGNMDVWSEIADPWWLHLKAAGLRPGTVDQYVHRITGFARWSQVPPERVTRELLTSYLAADRWSQSRRRGVRTSLVAFFRWAVETGRLPADPAKDLPRVKAHVGVPRPVPEDVVRHTVNTTTDPRVRMALILAALAGLRRADPVLAEALTEHRESCGSSPWLFTGGRWVADGDRHITPEHLGKMCNKALPDGWTLHTVRHRFATVAYERTQDARSLQILLGHSDMRTTERYVAVSAAALRDMVNAVPSVGRRTRPQRLRLRGVA
jgi:site-specific recombinase XerD